MHWLQQDLLDSAYPPTVQSGGVYDLKASAQNNDRSLQYDVIVMSIGAPPMLLAAVMTVRGAVFHFPQKAAGALLQFVYAPHLPQYTSPTPAAPVQEQSIRSTAA